MTTPRTQWDVAKAEIVPHFHAFTYDTDDGPNDRAVVLCVEIGWLGLFASLCFELRRPRRRQ